MRYLSVILVLFGLVAVTLAQDNSGKFQVNLDITGLQAKVAESIRNVPIHPDDTGFNTSPGPIGKTNYNALGIGSVSYEFVHPNKTRGVGLKAVWYFYPTYPLVGAEAERNYTNAPGTDQRGYGAALTFLSLGVRGGFAPFSGEQYGELASISPEVTWNVGKTQLSVGYFTLQAITGWDRYDHLEFRDSEKVADVFPISATIMKGHMVYGLQLYLVSPTKGSQVSTTLGVRLGYSF